MSFSNTCRSRMMNNILNMIFNGGSSTQNNVLNKSIYTKVVAGDVNKPVISADDNVKIPDKFQIPGDNEEKNASDYEIFKVYGNSMLPNGIMNGDILLCKKVDDDKKTSIEKNDLLVLEIDKERESSSVPRYDYKLRKALAHIGKCPDFESVRDDLLNDKEHSEIVLEKNQEILRQKLEKALKRYPNEQLLLSTTYKDGVFDYSIHPERLIRYNVIYYARFNDQNLEYHSVETENSNK